MSHLTIHQKLLVTIPSFADSGVKSILPDEGGGEGKDRKFTVILPKGTIVRNRDVSLYLLEIDADSLDPFPPLPNTHSFYLSTDKSFVLSRVISDKRGDKARQYTCEICCRASELKRGINRACRMQRPRKRTKAMPKRLKPDSIETLATRAEAAKLAAECKSNMRRGR